jgi:hypothetical protein
MPGRVEGVYDPDSEPDSDELISQKGVPAAVYGSSGDEV